MKTRQARPGRVRRSCRFSFAIGLQHGPGQGGLQGRQQALQGRELPEGHRGVRRRRSSSSPTWRRPTSTWAAPSRRCSGRARTTPRTCSGSSKAIEHYKKSLETEQGRSTENLKKVRTNTLGALTGIYSEPPLQDFEKALDYAQRAPQGQPERHQEPLRDRQPLREVREDPGGGGDLPEGGGAQPAGRQGLRGARRLLQQAALGGPRTQVRRGDRTPWSAARASTRTTPAGYYKVATFYWDKAYRDPLLTDPQKDEYADKGLEAVDKALRDQARLLGGHHHQGPALPREGPGGQEPEGAAAVPGAGRDPPEAGHGAAQGAAEAAEAGAAAPDAPPAPEGEAK